MTGPRWVPAAREGRLPFDKINVAAARALVGSVVEPVLIVPPTAG